MRKNYKKQILDYNIVKFSLMVRDDINIFLPIKIPMQVDKNIVLQVNSISDVKKIRKKLKWYIKKMSRKDYGIMNLAAITSI